MTREAETVEKIAPAIEIAELEWKAANGGDDASCLDCPDSVKADAALSVIREIVFEEAKVQVETGLGFEFASGIEPFKRDRTMPEFLAALIEVLGSGKS